MAQLLLDTGVLLALLNAGDSWYPRCREMADSQDWDFVIPSTVVVELDYFLRQRLPPGGWKVFYEDLEAGRYRLEIVNWEDIRRSVEICRTYEDADLQLVDASIVAVAERLGEKRVATVDRADFRMVKPSHCDAFELFPEGPDAP